MGDNFSWYIRGLLTEVSLTASSFILLVEIFGS